MYTFQVRNCGSKSPCADSSSSSSGKGLRTSSPPSGITAAYYFREKESAPDARYVDLYGHVLQYKPDWACRIDGTLCTVELERTSHRKDLYS